MYIEKTKTNKYKFVETYTDECGNRKKISVTLSKNTKQERNKAFLILQEKIKEKLDVFNLEYHFLDAFEKYVEYKKKILKQSSFYIQQSIYKKIIKNAFNWKLNELKAKHILSIFREDGKNLHYKIAILKDFIKWCYDISFLQKIQIPKRNKKENMKLYLEKEELQDVLEFYKDDELTYLTIKILVNTGLRIGELLALNYDDIENDTIKITKTLYNDKIQDTPKTKTSKREIAINKETITAFKTLRQRQKTLNFKDNRIFVGENKQIIQYKLKKYKKIHLHPHASLLIEKGIPIEAVSRRLGHKNTQITQEIYIHLTKKIKEKEDKIFKNLTL